MTSYIDLLYSFGPNHVGGGTFILKEFALMMTDYGLDKNKLSLKSVRFGGDPVSDAERGLFKSLWNAEPFDSYASTEAGFIAQECYSHAGMHVSEPDVFLTSIELESGEEMGQGETGKDLCTNLYEDQALPATFFINYTHRDNITFLKGGCSCGSSHKLIGHPTRDVRKPPLTGFGFDVKSKKPILTRAARRIRRTLSRPVNQHDPQ